MANYNCPACNRVVRENEIGRGFSGPLARDLRMSHDATQSVKLVISGSRTISPELAYDIIESELANPDFQISQIIHGKAKRGVDVAADQWAKRNGFNLRTFPAKWQNRKSPTFNEYKGYDPLAGFERNLKMAKIADRLLAIWDGKSSGTEQMINCMKALGKPYRVIEVKSRTRPTESPVTVAAPVRQGGLLAGYPERGSEIQFPRKNRAVNNAGERTRTVCSESRTPA